MLGNIDRIHGVVCFYLLFVFVLSVVEGDTYRDLCIWGSKEVTGFQLILNPCSCSLFEGFI